MFCLLQAREFVESIPIEVIPREAPPRRKAAAAAAKYKDVSSDDDMSDLMEDDEAAPLKPGDDGYELSLIHISEPTRPY